MIVFINLYLVTTEVTGQFTLGLLGATPSQENSILKPEFDSAIGAKGTTALFSQAPKATFE